MGESWVDLDLDTSALRIRTVYADPSDSHRLFLGLEHDALYTTVGGPDPSLAEKVLPIRVVRTYDHGTTWEDVPNVERRRDGERPYARIVKGAHTPGSVLYACLGSDFLLAHILRSTDSGKTWTVCGNQEGMGRVESLHVMQEDPQRVIAGMANGSLYRTLNSGKSWEKVPDTPGWGTIHDIHPDSKSGDILYIATRWGVYRGLNPVGPGVLRPARD
jgi:hypothetical protein